ncbi:hypothetical protein MJO29_000967 [Puccinia striiformis f. sp. tritici]|uniref:Core domain-containing protein n=2 Tax=Puccinia striiformis TaxID=27350 RepID=A0A2S4V0J8_9BASI|nr:hypothetical protein MJO29_000967 [Puccinia striiformis f. sp. tritici]POW03047.1 hypothetical protein PSTT_11362 [Puccinia striiformis]POW17509.1 hypothetical protein PSHT_06348 [Puccinia striiformis]
MKGISGTPRGRGTRSYTTSSGDLQLKSFGNTFSTKMSTSKLMIIVTRPSILRSSIRISNCEYNPTRFLATFSLLTSNKPDKSRLEYASTRQESLKTWLRQIHQDATTSHTADSSIQSQPQTNSNLGTTFATLVSTPIHRPSEDLSSPPSIVKPVGIKISPSAIEQIERVRKMDNKPNEVLRLSVESGGCHGFQYKIAFTESPEDDDFVFTVGNRSGLVVIDEGSLGLMDGSTIEFATELIGSSFRIIDNPHSAGKGCGCGVSWELK